MKTSIGVLGALALVSIIASAGAAQCPGDNDGDSRVTVDEIVAAAVSALEGCPDTRFVDNRDGTITDNQTGLMWEKKVIRHGAANALQDVNSQYRWAGGCSLSGALCQPDAPSEAACLSGVEGSQEGCMQCDADVCVVLTRDETVWQWLAALNASDFAGYSDWRMPTVRELESLRVEEWPSGPPPVVDPAFNGALCGAGCTDITDPACSCISVSPYWSASSNLASGAAWLAGFFDGQVSMSFKANGFRVRAVRGRPAVAH